MNILVLGIGNILMADEGVGIRAVEMLENRYCFPESIELMDGGTSGIELLRFIEDRDALILIDCVKSGHAPGTVLRAEGEDVPATFRTRISPHQLGLSDLLATASLTDSVPKRLVLFGVEPKEITLRLEMSPEATAGMERLVGVVIEELRGLGCSVIPREGEETSCKTVWKSV